MRLLGIDEMARGGDCFQGSESRKRESKITCHLTVGGRVAGGGFHSGDL